MHQEEVSLPSCDRVNPYLAFVQRVYSCYATLYLAATLQISGANFVVRFKLIVLGLPRPFDTQVLAFPCLYSPFPGDAAFPLAAALLLYSLMCLGFS